MTFSSKSRPFVKYIPAILSELQGCSFLLVVAEADEVAGWGEGSPGDVEPARGGEELVGEGVGLQERDQTLELLRVLGADVGSLTQQVLRVADATDEGVDARVAVAGVDDDGTDRLSGGFQQHQAAVGHVRHVLHGGGVVGVLFHVDKLAKSEVRRE